MRVLLLTGSLLFGFVAAWLADAGDTGKVVNVSNNVVINIGKAPPVPPERFQETSPRNLVKPFI